MRSRRDRTETGDDMVTTRPTSERGPVVTPTEPAHVWVISEGDADCYAVLQAFSTEQEARRYAEQLSGRSPDEILVTKIQLQGIPTTGRYGPQTEQIEHFVDLVKNSTPEQAKTLATAWAATQTDNLTVLWPYGDIVQAAGRDTEWQAAIDALYDAMRSTSWYVARRNPLAYIRSTPDYPKPDPELENVWTAMLNAALALMAWDLVGQYGLTQDHVETLIGQAESVFGPLRPVSGGAS
jgi:hypothetical protein